MIDHTKQSAALNTLEAEIGSAAIDRSRDLAARMSSSAGTPLAVIQPLDEAQLALVLKRVREAGGAIQTVCNGASGRETAAADGVIIVDLQRLSRVIEVNPELAYCLVEPGVTFRQLDAHLKENAYALWVDYPGHPDESVAASFINRRSGYTPYADHCLMQCGLEVMLADGRVVRTGMGAMPESTCWQLFKFGYGPWVDGLFTQSDFAVVTKVGMWMMPQPPAYQVFAVTVPNEDDLGPLLDVLGPLKLNMVVANGVAVANALHEAALTGRKRRDLGGSGPLAAKAVQDVGKALGLGYWTLYGAIYGLPGNVPILWQAARDAFASIPGARLITDGGGMHAGLWRWRTGNMTGVVADAPGTIPRWNGGQALTANPVSPVDGGEAMKLYTLSRNICAQNGFDFVGETHAIWRSANHRQWLAFAPGQQAAKARVCATELIAAQAEAGFGQIGADPELAADARKSYVAGNLGTLYDRVKRALDPTNLFVSV